MVGTTVGSRRLKVLVACEFSGIVRDAFAALGHVAYSCDLLPAETYSPWHLQCDVTNVLRERWDLMIAHPPCTRLCNSGVRWLHERDLWNDLQASVRFWRMLADAPIPHIAMENPIPHKYARELIGRPDQYVQPWQFGHGETKAIGLWLKNLPKLVPTNVVEGRQAKVHRASPGPDRWKERSRFYPGIAAAMAAQWTEAIA